MAGMGNYLEQYLLDAYFGGQQSFSNPSNIYLGLFTSAPSDSGGGTECSGGSYARADLDNDSTGTVWGSATSSGTKSNSSEITFPEATAGWGTVTHWALFDAASGGNLLCWGSLSTPRSIITGDTPKVAVGALQLTLD